MRFRSPLLSQSRFLFLPPGTEMVHFPGFARTRLWIHRAVLRFYRSGFPHSDIPGSMPACGSPRLIAACHVLHRLLLPRHPPCALSSLTIKFTRHTAGFAAAFSYQRNLHAPANFMGLILLIARLRSPLWTSVRSVVVFLDHRVHRGAQRNLRRVHQQVSLRHS